MSFPLNQTLLSVTGFVVFALAIVLLASAGELMTAGLLCLLACMTWHRDPPPQRCERSPDRRALEVDARRIHAPDPRVGPQRGLAACQQAPDHSRPRPLPEGLPSSFGLAILDRSYRLVWCTDTAAAHFGMDAQHDIGRPFATLVRHPSCGAYLAAGNFSKSLRIPTTENDGLILSAQFVPYVADGWLVVSRNITRAARLEAARRECIANVSHELRTPLTLLAGFLETVRELKLDSRSSRDYLGRMEQQCGRMQRIIEDLLQLSELESGPEPSAGARVNVGAVIARVQAEASALSAGRHRVVLEAEYGFDLLGAESEIASAFGNLANNAVRYTEPGGVVRLVWRASPAGAEFTVEDTGLGIERKHIPRLTERFYRVHRDRSCHSGGTGLGLAIVKHVLHRHQATLEIESEPGKGSRFTARFPAHRVMRVTVPTVRAGGGVLAR